MAALCRIPTGHCRIPTWCGRQYAVTLKCMDCDSLSECCEEETMTKMTNSRTVSRLIVLFLGVA